MIRCCVTFKFTKSWRTRQRMFLRMVLLYGLGFWLETKQHFSSFSCFRLTMFGAINMMLSTLCVILCMMAERTHAHGRLIDPPSRSSMWRFGFKTPINYDDNQLFCGGYDVSVHKLILVFFL